MSRDALAEEQRLRVQVLSEVPRVAGRHLHDRRVDRNELAARDLGAAAAGGADAERDLVTAAPVIARPARTCERRRRSRARAPGWGVSRAPRRHAASPGWCAACSRTSTRRTA